MVDIYRVQLLDVVITDHVDCVAYILYNINILLHPQLLHYRTSQSSHILFVYRNFSAQSLKIKSKHDNTKGIEGVVCSGGKAYRPQQVHELLVGHQTGVDRDGQKALVHRPGDPRQIRAQVRVDNTINNHVAIDHHRPGPAGGHQQQQQQYAGHQRQHDGCAGCGSFQVCAACSFLDSRDRAL